MTRPLSTASPIDAIAVRDSGVHGHGAFATCNLPRGRTIGVYEGRRYAPGEARDIEWDGSLTYVFGLSDGSIIDAAEGGNATRHINHSCLPNCVAYEDEDEDGAPRVVIHARRRIRAGEELFIDYGLDVAGADPADYPCRCGAPQCRGTLVALA